MLRRLKLWIKDFVFAVKSTFNRNKPIAIAFAVAAVLGIILGFSGAKIAAENSECSNVITKISCGKFNFLLFYAEILLIICAAYFIAVLTTFNPLVFLLNVPLILFLIRYFFRRAFICCYVIGWKGILALLIIYIPLLIINWLIYVLFMANIYDGVCSGCNWKRITPLKCNRAFVGKLLKKYLLYSIWLNIVYTVLVLIILAVIF